MWHDRLAFRAGYRLALDAPSDATTSGPAFGMGAGLGSMWLDYAFLLDGGTTSGEHRIGLTFHPGVLQGMNGMGGSVRGERSAVEASPRREAAPAALGPRPVVASPPPPQAGPRLAPSPPPTVSSKPLPPDARPIWIVVAPGETLASLAKRWDTTVTTLMMTNNLVSDRVAPGQQLKLPPPTGR